MSILAIVLVLAVGGFFCWLALQIPMPAPWPQIICGVVAFLLVMWVLQELGVKTPFPHVRLW